MEEIQLDDNEEESEKQVDAVNWSIMNKLCKQISIESPGSSPLIECVSSQDVPVPDVPPYGALIRVVYAGACFRVNRNRSASICSTSSVSSIGSLTGEFENFAVTHSYANLAYTGLRDASLFPGYEVAGIVNAIGKLADETFGIQKGQRIVLYPYEGVPHGYAEYIVVPDFKCLVPVPDNLPLSVAAMLPTGALLAMNTVFTAHEYVRKILTGPNHRDMCKILVVGTGGLALWALRIASHNFKNVSYKDKVKIAVASIRDEGFVLGSDEIKVVQWSQDLYEKQIIERTIDACSGPVDIVMNFGTTSRSLNRALQCLASGGVVLVTEDVGDKLLPKFSKKAEDLNVFIRIVPNGSIEQLRDLVQLVASKEIEPPPHSVFPIEDAQEVVRRLANSEINGRAILRFPDRD